MTKSGKEHEREATDRPALDPARMSDFSEAMKLNPLMANMAAATAIGFGIATQMAGVFFGALQGAMEAGNRQKAGDPNPAEASPIAETPAPEKTPASAETPAVAEPVVAAATAKPVAAKPKAPRKAAAPALKAAPVAEPVRKPAAKAAPAKAAPKAAPKVSARQPAPVKPTKAKTAKASAGGGDLKRISGIGPKLEGVLNDMGVTSLAQVAAWNEADIARFDKELGFEGRISRDDWVGQAKALLK
ncbi:5' DNA nuclease [Neorhizobium sp. T6_25]|uniref:5' DNA nuclease n=1 Tax=Neorhizobium sp. T6_25 TaxID=2093833 RepID=UPI001FE0D33D|nr:5' DNA nuclease [Neorhizobium sp. T6_25]